MALDNLLWRFIDFPGARRLWNRFPVGSVKTRVRYGIFSRPYYAFGVYSAADLASKLGLPAISVLEMGVAGGRGLLALEAIAADVSKYLKIQINVYGFDSGAGLTEPRDYRDLPHVWGAGFYKMDVDALKQRLRSAQLVLGNVASTIPTFLDGPHPPIGFVAFDLDYYSSTKAAFELFEAPPQSYLPRVYCYFDDIMWPENACHNEYVGELCAIREFNLEHEHKAICPIHMLRYMQPSASAWHDQMYVFHDFTHPLYCVNLTPHTAASTQLALEPISDDQVCENNSKH
jgi:hypothetical protein